MPINIQVSPQYQGVIEQAGAPQNIGVSPNFQSFNTLADIPANFTGTAQVGTQLYVGDGSALTEVGGGISVIKKLTPQATLGTLATDNIGGNNQLGTGVTLYSSAKANKRLAAPEFLAKSATESYIKMVAPGTDASLDASLLFSINSTLTPITDTQLQNICFSARAMPRSNGEKYGSLFVRLGAKASASNGLNVSTAGTPYYDIRLAIKCDGKERMYCLALDGFLATNAPADGKGNFNHGTAIGGIQFRLPYSGDCCKPPVNPANHVYFDTGDTVYIGAVYYNAVGSAKAFIRFDDNQLSQYSGTYKGIVNPNRLLDYIPNLAATTYPDANACGFIPNSCGTGLAFLGKSGVKILNGEDLSIAALVARFGFTATTFILCRHVDLPGFTSVAHLKTLRDTYGWLVAFQTYNNPVSSYQQGVTLLGPVGYNTTTKYTTGAAAAPSIAAIETASSTPTLRMINVGVGSANTTSGSITACQGYPVVFEASSDLPTALSPGVTYWLNVVSTTNPDANTTSQNISIHTTEADSATGTNPVNIVSGYTGTAANIVWRYANSTPDYTGILADFVKGKEWFIANGFGENYKTWAPNQGAIDIYTEQAIDAFGSFTSIFASVNPVTAVFPSFCNIARTNTVIAQSYGVPDNYFLSRDESSATIGIATDNGAYTASCSLAAATDIITLTGTLPSNLAILNGQRLVFSSKTGGAGITAATGSVYFAVNAAADGLSFKVAATLGGAAINITSDGTATLGVDETVIRELVRNNVLNGSVFSNLQHSQNVLGLRQLVYYLDECKFWSDNGMLVVKNADEIAKMFQADRL